MTTTWDDLAATEPDFERLCRDRLEAQKLSMLATLRADGFPRISGVEALLVDGAWVVGMMLDSRKALDLRRDPRCALHAATVDHEVSAGDVKVTARATELGGDPLARYLEAFAATSEWVPEPGTFHAFALHAVDVTRISVGGGGMQVDTWTPARGLTSVVKQP